MGKENTQPNSFSKRWTSRFSARVIESLLITFGVLLGLMLNEWRENANKSAFVEKSVEAIDAELSRNFDLLVDARSYRLKLYPDILSVIAGKKKIDDIPFRGMRGAPVQTAAYKIALQSAVFTDLDTEDSAQIVRTYQSIEGVEKVYSMYAGVAPTIVFLKDGADKQVPEFMRMAFMDFLYSEEEAINEIADRLGRNPLEPWYTKIDAFPSTPAKTERKPPTE